MIIDLPPHIEQVIIAKAQAEQISVEDLITKWAKQETEVNPMIARALANPNPSVLGKNAQFTAFNA
ncbi:hypothetical protein [Moraxella sp. ZY210820]|uniref:hypothetical protein n=1 Tax=unclassified Moraxella TaxID=2685852 RepID=UPI0027309F20|nr:hypothetical protein [Moraxella sp. ZY210820]WLF84014.1 hypothetical protein LU301_00440 [Moraxella sp. ZY210820]